MVPVRLRACVAVSLLSLSLGACAADKEEPPPFDAGASPSPSSSESAGKQPWEKKTEAGRRAFVTRFFEAIKVAFEGNNRSPLSESSAPGCKTCSNWISLSKDFNKGSREYKVDRMAPAKIRTWGKRSNSSKTFQYNVELLPRKEKYKNDSGKWEKKKVGPEIYETAIAWEKGQWWMLSVERMDG